MAVRIMTQSLFPGFFRVCPYSVCFIGLQGHCIFGQCTDTKVQGPGTDRSITWRLMETKGLKKVPRPAQFEDALFILALIWPRSRVRHWARMNFEKVRAEVPSAQFRPKILT
jgi:hypothetical protein